MSFTVLAIGDPHFKDGNAPETDLMTAQIVAYAKEIKPSIIVVLGDVYDRFDKLNLATIPRVNAFLRALKPLSSHLYVLVGNHDRPNNNDFLTEKHAFGALEEWSSTTVVDKVKTAVRKVDGKEATFAFAPYVHSGKLAEALATVELKAPYTTDGKHVVAALFAHQEFKGAKMNTITSNDGDPWPLDAPLCVSGHIHDFQLLQPNLIYTGTPIQHGYTDTKDKTISLFRFGWITRGEKTTCEMIEHTRQSIRIPRKIRLILTPEELCKFEVPADAHVQIKMRGAVAVFNEVMKLDHVKKLLATHGVTIKRYEGDDAELKLPPLTAQGLVVVKTRAAFSSRLTTGIAIESASVKAAYAYLFGSSS